jgi:hypothetical protein
MKRWPISARASQAQRLEDLECENARLFRAFSNLTIDKLTPQQPAWGRRWASRVDAGAPRQCGRVSASPSAAPAVLSASIVAANVTVWAPQTTETHSRPPSSPLVHHFGRQGRTRAATGLL